MKTAAQRLLALDILRGITIAGMIMVNNPGSWGSIYAPLKHAAWNGLTPTDLVFPFFMFIMGISTYISLRKYHFEFSRPAAWKIIKRTLVIFAIGLGIAWFSLFCRTWNTLSGEEISFWSHLGQSAWTFDRIRILGVMQRLALCYCATALIALTVKHKYIPYLIAVLLVGYWFVLLFGNGFEYNETNLLSFVDRTVLGLKHVYKDNGIEPEGLLSTIPAIAHVLIGFCCGKLLLEVRDIREKMLRLFLIGTVLSFSGFLLSYGCPINKKIWSPTFVLATCGLASAFLSLLIRIIDVNPSKSPLEGSLEVPEEERLKSSVKRRLKAPLKGLRVFFESFGINPLFMYVAGAVFSILLGNIRLHYGEGMMSLHAYTYNEVLRPLLGEYLGSLMFAVLFVSLVWALGYVLYKKKIYIKI
ncbi:MAG: heparan-alpha-glucosaminide N-acetyltransferase domain-containing protein [Candidatus Symbiothrix sp.]|jgi:predicted acyltransferase|nr:heparan-alpha-glucosaminide N-acetyltransferase domain-containing protein [Candidatus Symbiothrix sp.]